MRVFLIVDAVNGATKGVFSSEAMARAACTTAKREYRVVPMELDGIKPRWYVALDRNAAVHTVYVADYATHEVAYVTQTIGRKDEEKQPLNEMFLVCMVLSETEAEAVDRAKRTFSINIDYIEKYKRPSVHVKPTYLRIASCI